MQDSDHTAVQPGLEPGLYLVSVPIGAANDITVRALDVLRRAELLAAEDTRVARRLLALHDIRLAGRQLIAYNDQNGIRIRPRILDCLRAGQSVAYLPDAGTPMVSDPGFDLGRAAIENDISLFVVPGPSAPLTALLVSGLPTDRFMFAGFPPRRSARRLADFRQLADVPATLLFCVPGHKIGKVLADMIDVFGGHRQAAICRELTKKFEEVRRGTLAQLHQQLIEPQVKGEVVVVVDRAREEQLDDSSIMAELRSVLPKASPSEAARIVARTLGLPRRRVYEMALTMAADEED